MLDTHGYPEDMTLREIRQAEADKAEAYRRQRQLEQDMLKARWHEEDVPLAAEYGLSVEQAWNLFYDLLTRYEERYT